MQAFLAQSLKVGRRHICYRGRRKLEATHVPAAVLAPILHRFRAFGSASTGELISVDRGAFLLALSALVTTYVCTQMFYCLFSKS